VTTAHSTLALPFGDLPFVDQPFVDQPFLPSAEDWPEVNRWRQEGRLRRLIGDVHLAADLPVTAQLRARAIGLLLLGGQAGAVVGFGTAAWVHAGWPVAERLVEAIDLVLPPDARCRPAAQGRRLRQMRLTGRHVQRLAGVPVTTPARTAADLARDLPPLRAGAAMAALREATGVTVADVLRCLDEMPRARGSGHARLVVASWLG
jgi:hypothetical protein